MYKVGKNAVIVSIFYLASIQLVAQSPADTIKNEQGQLVIQPILHATMALTWNDFTIYIDPYGGEPSFRNLPQAELVLITDIHGDHMNLETLGDLGLNRAKILAPQAVVDQIKDDFENAQILNNDEKVEINGIEITAVPMYNLPETAESRHPKGRGNGYVLNFEGTRIYISGDTEDIPEMRALKDIDIAFVCMNMPYTMEVETAADAVLEFKPSIVYPFHFRGKDGLSDVSKFKKLVNKKNKEIEVRLRQWYPEKDE